MKFDIMKFDKDEFKCLLSANTCDEDIIKYLNDVDNINTYVYDEQNSNCLMYALEYNWDEDYLILCPLCTYFHLYIYIFIL
jgi:hypothetical protein